MSEELLLHCTEDMPMWVDCEVTLPKTSNMVFLMHLDQDVHVDEYGHVHIGSTSWNHPVENDVIPLGSQSSCEDY